MKVTLRSEIGPFQGSPTVGALISALSAFPNVATVTVETWDSQMDGSGWRIKAHWQEER